MSIIPIITFKAGVCNMDNTATPPKVVPRLTPGYLYLYEEDELIHFCWRPRVLPVSEAHVDLVMVPGDGAFVPYEPTPNPSTNNNSPPTNGRIYVLKFLSSSQRHLFWLQSKSQHPSGNPSWFSPRDLKLGQIVNQLLQGEEVNVAEELATAGSGPSDGDDDGDATMEDAETATRSGRGPRGGSGGAGPGATGGDIREEGEESREGGADGARAASASTNQSTHALVQSFLQSLSTPSTTQTPQTYLTLPTLLSPPTTLPTLSSLPASQIHSLLSNHLPPNLPLLAFPHLTTTSSLTTKQEQQILEKVLRSPQFSQACGALTMALREGGLEGVAGALGVEVQEEVDGGGVGGFLGGVRRGVELEMEREMEVEGGEGEEVE